MRIFEFSDENESIIVNKQVVAFSKQDKDKLGIAINGLGSAMLKYKSQEDRDSDYEQLRVALAQTDFETGE